MANPTPTKHRRATQITNEIATLGFALPGSVALRYTTCGTSGCRCHADPPQPHGPYPSWTRKVAGKTITDASAPSSRPTTSPGSKPTDAYASYSPNSRPSPWRSSRQNCDQRPAPKGPTPDRDEKHRPPRGEANSIVYSSCA